MYLEIAKSEEDIEFLYNTRRHLEVDKMLSSDPPKSMSGHKKYLHDVQEKTKWIYIAREEKMIGYSQIYDVFVETVEIGFVIHPDYQGKGFGKSLVLETVDKAQEKFPDKKIILYVLRDNPKAIHIYKKLGFVEKKLPQSDNITLGMELNYVTKE